MCVSINLGGQLFPPVTDIDTVVVLDLTGEPRSLQVISKLYPEIWLALRGFKLAMFHLEECQSLFAEMN